MLYKDRYHAGRVLGVRLEPEYGRRGDVVVLGLPRGGVPVAFEVARALGAPLDVFVVRKLGVPGQEELAMGALASGGTRVLNELVIDALGIPDSIVEQVTDAEARELARREQLYRGDREPVPFAGRTVILVDDGLATGATMRAAVLAVRQRKPARAVIAVPVAAASTCEELLNVADDVVCAATPEPFFAVGAWYDNFAQTSDDEVRRLLERAAPRLVA